MQQQQCCSGTKTGGSTSTGGRHGENKGMFNFACLFLLYVDTSVSVLISIHFKLLQTSDLADSCRFGAVLSGAQTQRPSAHGHRCIIQPFQRKEDLCTAVSVLNSNDFICRRSQKATIKCFDFSLCQ